MHRQASSPSSPGAISLTALLALTLIVCGAALTSPARAATTAISAGSLTWGFKESWRNYAGAGTVSEGATVNGDGTYSFPVSSGSFDDETDTTILELDGRVHWQAYPDYPEPGKWGLDTTFTDLRLEIGPTAQVLRGTHIGYLRSDPGGALHVDEGVVLAKLQIGGAGASFAGGTSSWSGIGALAGPGFSIYPEGTVLDTLSFQYVGSGGVPDLGEHFDKPGQVVLEPEGRWVTANPPLSQTREARDVFARGAAGVVHIVEGYDTSAATGVTTISAHDPVTLQPVGTPLAITYQKNQGHYVKFGFDPTTDTLFYVTGRDGANQKETTVRRARWNPVTESYDQEAIGHLDETAGNIVGSVVWNPVRHEVGVTATTLASSGFNHIADLYTFRQSGGVWESDKRPIVVPETGQLEGLSAKLPQVFGTVSPLDGQSLAVARDGSYIQAPESAVATVGGGAKVPMPALRIEPEWGASPVVTLLWDTQLPEEPGQTYFSWGAASIGADGSVLLNGVGSRVERYVRVDVDGDGDAVVDPIVDAPQGYLAGGNAFATSMAGDPVRGWEWATDRRDPDGYTVDTLIDDEVVSRFAYPELISPTAGFPVIDVGLDGAVYLPIEDSATEHFGYQRLAIEGVLPTFAGQPAAASVSLEAGEQSRPASFTSTVSGGQPAATRQWQVEPAAGSSFTDIEGATGPDLTVAATREMNGNRYRAVYTSAAGTIASDAATLTVEYAPRLVSQPKNRTVTEGSDAVFLLGSDANPEPAVGWQRRVGGYWEDIAPGDDNFGLAGPSLTVVDTNTDQSGSLFRAKLVNPIGTVYSQVVKLTVEPKVSIPAGGVDLDHVSLDWTGNEEMQKAPPVGGSNYFSAGASDGSAATYSAAVGNVRVFQVAAGGGESLATYATRAAHLGGGEQLVRLYGGAGHVDPDGSASVSWQGSFSVNFYGGLVPFTFVDPELTVDDTGSGALSATMVGCASSEANPTVCEPFAAQPEVTVATFSGVEVDPGGEVAIEPDYDGVEVEIPAGGTPQNRTVAGWGAWPQTFVDFHLKTGLGAYWYSSGGSFDPDKPPSPLLVDFDGVSLPPAPAPAGGGPAGGSPTPSAAGAATVVAARRVQAAGGGKAVTVASLVCPAVGEGCTVTVPKRVRVRILGKGFGATVLAPRSLAAGGTGLVQVRLPLAAVRLLRGRQARVAVRIAVRSGGETVRRTLRVTVRGPLRTLAVGSGGQVALGTLRCEGGERCAVAVPARVRRRVGGRLVAAAVEVPRTIAAGGRAELGLRLDERALERLGSGSAVFRVRAVLRAGSRRSVQVLEARLRRRQASPQGKDPGAPQSGPVSAEPPLLARPATAVDVGAVQISWYPRDSWIRYASSGAAAGDGIFVSGGASAVDSTASACPDRPSPSDAALPYEIRFTPRASWYDPVSGTAAVYGSGSVRFRWKAHTIDLTASNPEIEINGAGSRAIFRFSGSEGTPYPDQRADLVSLDVAGQPTVTGGGKAFSYALMRGTLTENGVNVFAGFYPPPDNDEFGCVSVSFTTP